MYKYLIYGHRQLLSPSKLLRGIASLCLELGRVCEAAAEAKGDNRWGAAAERLRHAADLLKGLPPRMGPGQLVYG